MTLTTVRQYGRVAQAMALVHARKPQHGEASGTIRCTRCGSNLRFTIFANGISRGQCSARDCVRWVT